MPDIKVPNIDLEKAAADLNNAVKEAAYVAVGLGVLGFQRAQVRRVELLKQVESQLSSLSSVSSDLGSQAEGYVSSARQQLDELRSQLRRVSGEVLGERPDAAVLRGQLADLAKAMDEAVAPVRQQVEEQLDRLEDRLPAAGRDFVRIVRGAASAQEQAIRNAVGLS